MTSRAIPLCPVSHPSGGSAGVGAVGLSRRQPRSAGDGPAAARRSTGLPLLRSALQLLTPARARRECACAETRHARGLRTRPGVRGRGAEPPPPAGAAPPAGSHRSHRPPPSPPGVSPRVSTRAWWPQDTPSQRVPVALAASAPRLQHSGRPAPPPRPGGRSRAPARSVSSSPSSGSSHSTATTRYKSLPADFPHPPVPRQVPVLQHPLPRATADNASPSPAHALPTSHAPVPSSSHPTASRLHPH